MIHHSSNLKDKDPTANPRIAIEILQKWQDDFPPTFAGCCILQNGSTRGTYTIT